MGQWQSGRLVLQVQCLLSHDSSPLGHRCFLRFQTASAPRGCCIYPCNLTAEAVQPCIQRQGAKDGTPREVARRAIQIHAERIDIHLDHEVASSTLPNRVHILTDSSRVSSAARARVEVQRGLNFPVSIAMFCYVIVHNLLSVPIL